MKRLSSIWCLVRDVTGSSPEEAEGRAWGAGNGAPCTVAAVPAATATAEVTMDRAGVQLSARHAIAGRDGVHASVRNDTAGSSPTRSAHDGRRNTRSDRTTVVIGVGHWGGCEVRGRKCRPRTVGGTWVRGAVSMLEDIGVGGCKRNYVRQVV